MDRTLLTCAALVCAIVGCSSLSGCDRTNSERSTSSPASESAEERAPSADEDQSRSGPTDRGHYYLEVTPDPNPIPFQEMFTLQIDIYKGGEREKRAAEASIDDLRAVMPAHDHGMKTAPSISRKGPGAFRAEGMRFHMRGTGEDGRWVLELVVNGTAGVDRVSFDLQCCRAR